MRCALRTTHQIEFQRDLGVSPALDNEDKYILVLDIFGKVFLLREDKTEISKSSCLDAKQHKKAIIFLTDSINRVELEYESLGSSGLVKMTIGNIAMMAFRTLAYRPV